MFQCSRCIWNTGWRSSAGGHPPVTVSQVEVAAPCGRRPHGLLLLLSHHQRRHLRVCWKRAGHLLQDHDIAGQQGKNMPRSPWMCLWEVQVPLKLSASPPSVIVSVRVLPLCYLHRCLPPALQRHQVQISQSSIQDINLQFLAKRVSCLKCSPGLCMLPDASLTGWTAGCCAGSRWVWSHWAWLYFMPSTHSSSPSAMLSDTSSSRAWWMRYGHLVQPLRF